MASLNISFTISGAPISSTHLAKRPKFIYLAYIKIFAKPYNEVHSTWDLEIFVYFLQQALATILKLFPKPLLCAFEASPCVGLYVHRHLADATCSSQNDQSTGLLKQQGVTHLLVLLVTEGADSNRSLGGGEVFQLLKIEFFMSPQIFLKSLPQLQLVCLGL